MAKHVRRKNYETFGETLNQAAPGPVVYERYQSPNSGLARLIYTAIGLLEALLLFRLVYVMFEVGSGNEFVGFIYAVTNPFVLPLQGIVGQTTANGATLGSSMDIPTLLAMIIAPALGWLVVRIISPSSNRETDPE